jgi:anaerobic selenocysteine-containing dehydrogenase
MWGGIPSFNPAQRLHEARKRGLKLIVIDPRRTETARKADLHLQCLPGQDVPLLAAMLQVIFAEGLQDRDFVAAETAGAAELAAAVAPFTSVSRRRPGSPPRTSAPQPGSSRAARAATPPAAPAPAWHRTVC